MRSSTSWFAKEIRFSYNPLFSFFSIATANSLLSYFDFSFQTELWIAFLGFGLPLALVLCRPAWKGPGELPPWERELFPNLSFGWWALWGFLVIIPRLFQLTGLSVWPFTDEGYAAFFSIQLSQKWAWKFFFNFTQVPFFFNWLLGIYFKWIGPSLRSLWLFEAFLSLFTVWIVGWAARLRFSKSQSWFFAILTGFSFWPLYVGRICLPENIVVFWQVVSFLLLALFWRRQDESNNWIWALMVGLAVGFGFFVAVAWPVMALSLCLFFIPRFGITKNNWKVAGGFWLGLLAMALPFALISVFERNGQYIRAVWAFYPGTDLKQQAVDFLSHVRALFWGFNGRRLYGPIWGGLLNPVLGALFFLGIFELIRARSLPLARWVLCALGLFLLPAAVARGYDTTRILLLLPLVLWVGVAGFQSLMGFLGGWKKILVLTVGLGLSMGLDSFHLFVKFHQAWGIPGNAWNFGKEYELWKSYEILRETDLETGPGALLFDLRAHVDDVTPEVAAYSFNAAMNPALSFADAKWVSVLMDADYLPFLSKRFPEGRFYWLCPKDPYGWWALGVIPMLPQTREVLGKWFCLNQEMQGVTYEMIDTLPGNSRENILDRIYPLGNKLEGDPFLESVYWEKIFDNRSVERDALGCLEAARHCVLEGYPLPHMYNEQGVILTQMGRYREARRAFEKALKMDVLKLTPAQENLQALNAAGK